MKKVKITPKMKAGIRQWLEYAQGVKPNLCPFTSFMHCREEGNKSSGLAVCHEWFPKMKRYGMGCPCQCYKLSTVERRARAMLKE